MLGRRNRTLFLLTHVEIILWCAALLTPFILFIIPKETPRNYLELTVGFCVLVFCTGLVLFGMNSRGRCHDLNISGFNVWLIFVPFSGIGSKLMGDLGTPYENDYGEPCDYELPPRSYFFGQLALLLITFGFLSALSFLYPAYCLVISDQQITKNFQIEESEIVAQQISDFINKKTDQLKLTENDINFIWDNNPNLRNRIWVTKMRGDEIVVQTSYPVRWWSGKYFQAELTIYPYRENDELSLGLRGIWGLQGQRRLWWLEYQDAEDYSSLVDPRLTTLIEKLEPYEAKIEDGLLVISRK